MDDFWQTQVDLAVAGWRVSRISTSELKSRGSKPITPDQ
jgi:hypothetical protein